MFFSNILHSDAYQNIKIDNQKSVAQEFSYYLYLRIYGNFMVIHFDLKNICDEM